MFTESITTAFFGSKTKSTAGTQAYQMYSEHSSEKGQSIGVRILISHTEWGKKRNLRKSRVF